jgi:hypothetical protein
LNGGSSDDNRERKEQIKINSFQVNRPYTTPKA